MIAEGDDAPKFALPGSDGSLVDEYRLDDYLDTGGVVLLFYPFDFSPVCTEELCTFRDSEWLGFTPDLDVFGVSTDSAFAHREVIQENDLPFPLLSDHAGTVSEQYDVLYDELENHNRVSKRAVFVIDDTATIRYAWEAEEWLTDPDIDEINKSIQAVDGIGF